MLPTFINIIMIFSFCNLHDLSWGTKGLEYTKEEVSYDTLCVLRVHLLIVMQSHRSSTCV